MTNVKHIKNTKYFAISLNGKDPWVMKPVPGNKRALRFGGTYSGLVWFFEPEEGLFIYEVDKKSLKLKIKLPHATKRVLGKEGVYPDFYHEKYEVFESADGKYLYHIICHSGNIGDGRYSIDIHIVEIESGKVVNVIKSLPGNFSLSKTCLLDERGKILFAASTIGKKGTYGLVRVDPEDGEIETSACEGSHAYERLHSPSPNGRYWLRCDNSQIPHIGKQPANKSLLGFNTERSRPTEYFGFAVEVWAAFPLQRVATVTPMWMTPHELPDNGHMDKDLYLDRSIDRRNDIGLFLEGKPTKRANTFRDIAKYLEENPEKSWNEFSFFRDGETEWLWPDKESYYSNIGRNLSDFGFGPKDLVGWQPDSQAFWVKRNWFLSCVGVDGTVSPKIMFERYGMKSSSWLPCAAAFSDATPLDGRRLKVRYNDHSVIADGSPEASTTAIRTIPSTMDRHTPVVADAADQELAEKADALARERSVYRIDLRSLDEPDCIAAIDSLTAEIGPDINERPYDNELEAVFVHGRENLDEKTFFSHVWQTCPSSAPALRRLITAICKQASHLYGAYYDPYGEKTGTSVGAFGFAAFCLAQLDSMSNDLLRKYGALIDTYHEHFYLPKIFKQMLDNEDNVQNRLSIAEEALLRDLGNNFDPFGFWKFAEMEKMASNLFSPGDYARRIVRIDKEINATDLNVQLMGPILIRLGSEMQANASEWEKAMLHELALQLHID